MGFFFQRAVCAVMVALALSLLAGSRRGVAAPVSSCVWDGRHDVAPCLQKSINAAASGKPLFLPKGRWPLGSALSLASNLTLQGNGQTTLVALPGNKSNPLLLRGVNISNVLVAGILLDGGGAMFTSRAPAVKLDHVKKVLFDHITIQHTPGIGIVIEANSADTGVEASTLDDIGNRWKITHNRQDRGQGLVFCCGDSNFGNYAISDHFADIGLDALQLSNQNDFTALKNTFTLEDGQMELLPSPDYPAAIFTPFSSNAIISGNVIDGAQGNGIDAPGLQNSVISSNLIQHCGAAAIGLFSTYDTKAPSHDVIIRSNLMSGNARWKLSKGNGGIVIGRGSSVGLLMQDNKLSGD